MNKALCFFRPRSSVYISGYPLYTVGLYILYWLCICSNIESLLNSKAVIKIIEYVRERKAEVNHIESANACYLDVINFTCIS